ncbi:hypothetical protein EOS_31535 [Caballeronia mineralivorans PML1(12)]|uniref:Uncharacterized protein n=1 Tax=Caballeronia mineralivorans PML1(12) TaxID=908627 RepID=A0A0J1CNG1_9BURK|nr:hypothetical protein [Caballeronia mineralivorans]KLU22232.1 hypothetical protein EOS_31535 [Caballeronia mineralivorans PML1(12)]
MKTEFPEWVPATITNELVRIEGAPGIYTQSDLACARRLVFSEQMRGFYADSWFRCWRSPECWSIWFNYAWHAASYEYDAGREAKRKHIDAMNALRQHLQAAARAMDAVDAAREDSPLTAPLEFADVFRLVPIAAQESARRGVAYRYDSHIRQRIERATSGYDLRYVPNASDLLHALSSLTESWLDNTDSNWGDSVERAAMTSRQAMPVPQYVRWFDEQMAGYGWTLEEQLADDQFPLASPVFETNHKVPDRLMAIQYCVATGLPPMEGFVDRIRKAREGSGRGAADNDV